MRNRGIWLLTLSHFINDINQGAIPALLPLLLIRFDLNYAMGAGIIFAANLASSIAQPLLGHLSDRVSQPVLLPLGMFLAGGGLAATVFAQDYWTLFAAVMVSGIGIAAFHPEAVRMAPLLSTRGKEASGVSLFALGGNGGFAVGPLLVAAFTYYFGYRGVALFALPVTVMAGTLMLFQSRLKFHSDRSRERDREENPGVRRAEWLGFSLVTVAVVGRAILFFGFNTFVPLYWTGHFKAQTTESSFALTVFALSGVAGTLLGGRLTDRFGSRPIIRFSLLLLFPLTLLFAFSPSREISYLLLPLIGVAILVSYSPVVLLAQSYLPGRAGLASGVTVGLAITAGGSMMPVFGLIADRVGIETVWYLLSIAPFVAASAAFFLPEANRARGVKSATG